MSPSSSATTRKTQKSQKSSGYIDRLRSTPQIPLTPISSFIDVCSAYDRERQYDSILALRALKDTAMFRDITDPVAYIRKMRDEG